MKTKTIIGTVVVAFALLFTSSCLVEVTRNGVVKGSGNYVKVSQTVDDFSTIKIDGLFDVIYSQRAGAPEVVIETDDNLEEYVKIAVKKGTLYIDANSQNMLLTKRKLVHVFSPTLTHVETDGVGSFSLATPLRTSSLELDLDGVGGFTTSSEIVSDGTFRINHDGVGSIKLESTVRATAFGLEHDGVGTFRADSILCSGNAELKSKGVGAVKVAYVKCDKLTANASGVGSLTVSEADATSVSSSDSGIGSVKVGKGK